MLCNNLHFEISERKVLLRFFDVLVVLCALFLVDFFLDFKYFDFAKNKFYWLVILAIYLNVIGTIFEMYNLQVASNQFQIIKSIVLTASTTVLVYLLTPFFTPLLPLSRLQILYFFLAIMVSLLVWRIFYQKFLASYRFEKRVILVCDQNQLKELVSDLSSVDPHYRVIGFINPSPDFVVEPLNDLINIAHEDVQDFVIKNNVSEIVVASKNTESITLKLYNQLLFLLENGFAIREYTQVYENLTQRIPIAHFGQDFYNFFPFSSSNHNKLYLFIVRILEIIFATVGLLIGSILMPFLIVGNFVANKGPLFYSQLRVGRNGIAFKIYKFRTMLIDAEAQGALFATQNDTRITFFGKFLRKTRIDEIPQFYNILKGDMALIGPRPERPIFVRDLSNDIPFYDTRHVIKPGLTGWAQVNYGYGESISDSLIKLQYDLYYIKHRSVFLDLNIVIKTCSTVLFYRGQ